MSHNSELEIGDIGDLLQQLGAIVWESFGAQWFVRYVSRHIQEALGFPEGRWNPDLTTWIGLLHPEDRERVVNLIVGAATSEHAVVFDDRVRRVDGGWMWLRNIVRRQRTADGEVGVQGFAFDISELKETQVALEEVNQKASFLAEISAIFARDLDYQVTLKNIVKMAVPGSPTGAPCASTATRQRKSSVMTPARRSTRRSFVHFLPMIRLVRAGCCVPASPSFCPTRRR